MSDKALWPKGPYSIHPFSDIQTRKTIGSAGDTYETAAITIGAGDKMLGEVRFTTRALGYPGINSEAEMAALARLWIAAPEMAEALRELLDCVDEISARAGWPDNAPHNKARALLSRIEGGDHEPKL